jgi:hypothetical protein
VNLSLALDRVGTAVIARRPLSRFIQIDRLVTVLTGLGSATSPPLYLPHGRYTLFMAYDPPAAVRSLSLIDRSGRGFPDWTSIPVSAGDVIAPLVQHAVPAGNYRMAIEASSDCAWQAQVVLNSMLSWEAPPAAFHRRLARPAPILLGNDKNPDFRTEQTGTYAMELTLGDFAPHVAQQPVPEALCPFELGLRAVNGHHLHLARATESNASWPPSFVFLGARDWRVEMKTECTWGLVIKPMVGSSGGGAYWF